jgi:CheY-like chemotaxis protein
MHILIVDDNRDILDLIERVLIADGHLVTTARDGLEALQKEETARPDLVVLDVNLPVMNGWEVCKRIKARRQVPVLLLTVRAERVDIEQSQAVGADAHMLKPFEITDFLAHIERFAPDPRHAPQ